MNNSTCVEHQISIKEHTHPRILHFDTDLFTIGVDDHYSYCICNNSDLFVTYLIPTKNIFVKGINGNFRSEEDELLGRE